MANETESRQPAMWAEVEPAGAVSPPAPVHPEAKGKPRLEPVNRQQMVWRSIDVERLIEEDHAARAIWELVGKQVLGLLSAEDLVRLQRVMHDGTKIKACAGADTFRREEKIGVHLELARPAPAGGGPGGPAE